MNYRISRKIPIRVFKESSVIGEVESRRLILRKGKIESRLHIILKILAYCYFWDRNLVIEPVFRINRFKPDLISWRKSEIPTEEKQIPDLWVECKNVKLKKLKKLSRILPHSQIVWFHSKQSLTRTIKSIQSRKKGYLTASNVQLIGITTSKDNWESLKESIDVRKPQWKINRYSDSLIVINVRESHKNPISLEFHIFPATIKT